MFSPTEFGIFLKEKRKLSNLTQDALAETIGKTSQYISNIEKGKNNAPPKGSDIEALISKLGLNEADAKDFRRLAAADRNQLSSEQMKYLLKHRSLLLLIDYGVDNEIKDVIWAKIFKSLSENESNAGSVADENER